MKKTFWITLIALVLSVFIAAPALAVYQDMHADVYKWTGGYNANGSPGLEKLTTGITYKVLAHDSDTAETLYAYNDRGMTAKTNPITTTIFAANDRIEFKVDPTDTTDDKYVDLIVTDTVGGYSTVVKHFDKYTHVVVIDERPNIMHHGVIWYTCSTTGEVDTGVDFVADTFVHDVRSEVVTTSTGGTIGVGLLSTGTGGNATGFLTGRAASVAGFTADTGVITAGASIDYVAATTYGALLYTAITGSSDASGDHTPGGRSYLGHIVTGTNTGALTYTCSTTTNSGAGYLHYFFTRMR